MGTNGRGTDLRTRLRAESAAARSPMSATSTSAPSARRSKRSSRRRRSGGREGVADFRKILDDKSVDAAGRRRARSLARPGHDPGLRRGQARVRREAVLPQPARRRADGRRRRGSTTASCSIGTQRRSSPAVIEAVEQLRKGDDRPRAVGPQPGTTTGGRRSAAARRRRCRRGSTTRCGKARPPSGRTATTSSTTTGTGSGTGATASWATTASTGSTSAAGAWASIIRTRVTSAGGKYRFDDDQETPDTHLSPSTSAASRSSGRGGAGTRAGSKATQFGMAFYGDEGDAGDRRRRLQDLRHAEQGDRQPAAGRAATSTWPTFWTACAAASGPTPTSKRATRARCLCHLGNIAYRAGRVLSIDPTNGHIKNDAEAEALWRREYRSGWEPKV